MWRWTVAEERLAPVQGYSAGIPWSMHLRAYDAYCKEHGKQQALIEGHCRGGFGVNELDVFIPGWREELSELRLLRAERDALLAERDKLAARVREVEAERDRLKELIAPFVQECDRFIRFTDGHGTDKLRMRLDCTEQLSAHHKPPDYSGLFLGHVRALHAALMPPPGAAGPTGGQP
jgi:hypothetical protein